MRVAIIDLGTNTCRLYLAEADGGEVRVHTRLTTVVRLGQGVDESGRLAPEAMARARACLEEYGVRLRAFAPHRSLLIATSVVRDAADGREFIRAVGGESALPTRVLSGEEEGALSFAGATAGLAGEAGARAAGATPGLPAAELVVVDIGGGSTEFSAGLPGQAPFFVRSLDIGAVRVTERCLAHDPPLAEEVDAAARLIATEIEAGVPAEVRRRVTDVVGVAGTFLTLAANTLGLRRYEASRVHGYRLSLADIDTAIAVFSRLTSDERGRLPGIQKGREDVIHAGALIAREALRAFGLGDVRCSEDDLLKGAALALAEGRLTPE